MRLHDSCVISLFSHHFRFRHLVRNKFSNPKKNPSQRAQGHNFMATFDHQKTPCPTSHIWRLSNWTDWHLTWQQCSPHLVLLLIQAQLAWRISLRLCSLWCVWLYEQIGNILIHIMHVLPISAFEMCSFDVLTQLTPYVDITGMDVRRAMWTCHQRVGLHPCNAVELSWAERSRCQYAPSLSEVEHRNRVFLEQMFRRNLMISYDLLWFVVTFVILWLLSDFDIRARWHNDTHNDIAALQSSNPIRHVYRFWFWSPWPCHMSVSFILLVSLVPRLLSHVFYRYHFSIGIFVT